MKVKFFVGRLFYIPRRVRKIIYIQLNRLKFKINGVRFGENMNIYNHLYLTKHSLSTIIIGDNLHFTSGEAFNPLCRNIRGCIYAAEGSNIEIGNNVGISSACIWANKNITIGNNVLIGGDCIIMDTDAHNLDYKIRRSNETNNRGIPIDQLTAINRSVIIEDDVFIGTRCFILKGVTIGARSIIGSGSVVTKSLPADCIAAGNPCKVIKILH